MPFAPLLALQLLLGCRDEASPPLGEGCDEACAPLQSWDFPPSVDPYHQAFDVVDRRLVARSRDFLHVFDASVTPPVLQGSVEVGFGTDVALAGERAYATTDYGVVVVDLSDPSAPVELGELFWVSDGSSFEAVVVAEGDTAWVLEPFTGSLWGVDATDPSDPVLLAELEVDAFDLHLSDDVLWCVGADGVQGLDVGVTPPVELGRFAAPGDIDRFGVAGDVLLASYWIPGGKTVDNGFVRWDLRDAAAPSLIDDIAADKPGCGQGRLVMDTDRAFLACPELHTFDLATGAYEPSALLDAVDVTLPLELLRDGERVHGMPVGSGLVEGAPWVSWSMDGSDVEAAELRPDALGGSVLGMVAAGQRLFVRVSGRTLVLDVDPVAGPAVADQWDVDVRHGHDGVVVTDEGLLDTLGEPVPAVLPAAVDGVELVGGGATLAGMRDLTLVVVGFTRQMASVVAEIELDLDGACIVDGVFCRASVAAVGEGHVVATVWVSGFVDGAYGSEERTVWVDVESGAQGALDGVGYTLGPAHLYGSDGEDLVVVDLGTAEEVGRLEGYAAGAMTVADGVLVGRTREGIQHFDLADPGQPVPSCLYPETLAGIFRGQVVDGAWFGVHYAGVDWVALGCGRGR